MPEHRWSRPSPGWPPSRSWRTRWRASPGADVAPLVEYGTELGRILAERCTAVIPGERIHSYGKSAIIGLHGEIEHAAALIHPTFGKSVRAVIGGGAAAIPSSCLLY